MLQNYPLILAWLIISVKNKRHIIKDLTMSKNLTGKKMPKFKAFATGDKEISNTDFENKNLVIYYT